MQFRVTVPKAFVAPFTYNEGDIIEYDGPIGMWMEPVDAEAKAKWEAWAEANPSKALGAKRPGDELEIVPAQASLVEAAPVDASMDTSGPVALPGTKAQPGLASGGVALKIKGTK